MPKPLRLLSRKTVLVPTLFGWLLLLAISAGLFFSFLFGIYPFLAANDPFDDSGDSDILVMEGWVPKNVVEETAQIIGERDYEIIISTGGKPVGNGHLIPADSFSEFGEMRLRKFGVKDKIIVLEPLERSSKRTRTDASAVKIELQGMKLNPSSITVVSADVHARRTKLVYQRLFGKKYPISAISVDPSGYPKEKWWSNSFGTKTVIAETIAFLYERFSP